MSLKERAIAERQAEECDDQEDRVVAAAYPPVVEVLDINGCMLLLPGVIDQEKAEWIAAVLQNSRVLCKPAPDPQGREVPQFEQTYHEMSAKVVEVPRHLIG